MRIEIEKRFTYEDEHGSDNINAMQLTPAERRRDARLLERIEQLQAFDHRDDLRMDIYVDDPGFAPQPQGFDVSVISPHSHTYSTRVSGQAIAAREREKRRQYRRVCESTNMELHPMVIDIYGRIGEGFEKGAQRIASFMAGKKGTSPLTEKINLLTTLTSLVVQCVAISINRRKLSDWPGRAGNM